MEKYKLTDYQWKLIKPLIPPKTSTCGRARRDARELINGIVWVLRTVHHGVLYQKNMAHGIQSITTSENGHKKVLWKIFLKDLL